MKHDELIKSLSDDLDPVKPIACNRSRCTLFILIAYIAIFLGAALIGFRSDIAFVFSTPAMLVQLSALMAAGILSVIASFRLSIPSETVGKTNWSLIGLSTVLLAGVMTYCAVGGDMSQTQTYLTTKMIIERLTNALLLAVVPAALMIYMVRQASPVHTSLVGFTSFMAVTCLSVIGCRLTCPIDDLYANLLWHYTPILFLSFVGYWVGRLLYRW